MDLKRLVTHFAYKIEPKPEGGFIACATDPSVPPLEAPTRLELQQKIQQNILQALSAEFPSLQLPPEGKHLEMSFHVEHQPGGGFSIHSSDPNAAVIHAADKKEFESKFLEKFLNFAGNHLAPEFSKALAAQVGSANIKIVVNKRTSFRVNSSPKGITFGAPHPAALTQNAATEGPKLSGSAADLAQLGGTIDSRPITPEPSNAGKVFGFLLLMLVVGGLIYLFFLHR
jgi:hypothetical protein